MQRLWSWLHGLAVSIKRHLCGNVALMHCFYVERANVSEGQLTIISELTHDNDSAAVFDIDKVIEVYFYPSRTRIEGDLDVVFATKNDAGGLVSRYAGTINIPGTSKELLAVMFGSLPEQTNFGDFSKDQLDDLRLYYNIMRAKKLNLLNR